MQTKMRSELRQMAHRGSNDWATINSILDAGFLASAGFCVDGQPFVIPMLYGRVGQTLYLHGSALSRMLKALEGGLALCASVTLVDGLVLARSAFNHSMNYRSVVAFGAARAVESSREKVEALRVISEHLVAGRWKDVRGPNKRELQQTTVLEFAMVEASSKIRRGPPEDDADDYSWPTWAGVVPLEVASRTPTPDPRLAAGIGLPDYLCAYNPSRDSAA
jgi:uncharacterized protein